MQVLRIKIHKHHFQQFLVGFGASELASKQTKYVAVKGQRQTCSQSCQMDGCKTLSQHSAGIPGTASKPTSPPWDRTAIPTEFLHEQEESTEF